MPILILIRHSRVDPLSVEQGADWPLSQEGRNLCLPLAEGIRDYEPQKIFSSVQLRARKTAELISGRLGIGWQTAEDLHEHQRQVVPATDAEFLDHMRQLFAEPSKRSFAEQPSGESADEALARFSSAMERLHQENQGQNLAVVSHGTVLALFAAPLFELSPFDLWQRLKSPSFVTIDAASGRGLEVVDPAERPPSGQPSKNPGPLSPVSQPFPGAAKSWHRAARAHRG